MRNKCSNLFTPSEVSALTSSVKMSKSVAPPPASTLTQEAIDSLLFRVDLLEEFIVELEFGADLTFKVFSLH